MTRAENLPLYQNHQVPKALSPDAHSGLWFNKMVNTWDLKLLTTEAPARGPQAERLLNKVGWLETLDKRAVGDPARLQEAVDRLQQLAGQLQGLHRNLTTVWRFATGLGLPHPVENGMVWHHTLGVPYLPGSAVKGVVRAWATQWADDIDPDLVQRLLGPEGKDDRAAGEVIFFDALPTRPVRLVMDYMTPHYAPYYQSARGAPLEPPADWHSPNPIPFLTVAENQTFCFAVAPRRAGAGNQAAQAMAWLVAAPETPGAGAKTSAGYGQFRPAPSGPVQPTQGRL